LYESLKAGEYRATAVQRIYLDKPDGGQRAIQLQTIEDKIVQGAVISPLLANIVLNEAMDQFVHHWRQHHAQGEVYIVRFAVDAVLSFEHKADAEVLQEALRENLWHYGLELNDAKTRLHPFGRNCPPRGPGKSASFDFLGLTHFVSRDRQGRYLVKRKTARKRLHRSLQALKAWCRKQRHKPLA
jgi:hypothetical protein